MDRVAELAREYRDALAGKAFARESAYIVPTVDVAGVECVLLTPRRQIYLQLADSPFVCGGPIDAAEIARTLWIISVNFNPAACGRDDFITQVGKLDSETALHALHQYFDDAFADGPGQSAGGPRKPSATGGTAILVDMLASEYGWDEEAILDIPLARIWQYVRRIMLRSDPKREFISRSTKIRHEGIKAQRQQREQS